MRHVYEVKFEKRMRTVGRKWATWSRNNDPIHVLANGTADAAIRKAKAHLIGASEKWTDDNGAKRVDRCIAVKVTSVERVLTIDA